MKFPVSNAASAPFNPDPPMTSPILRIAIGTDHGAVELKNAVAKH